MTYSITIRRKGVPFKNATDHATLKKQFAGAVKLGGLGRYFEFVEEPAVPAGKEPAAYMLYGAGSPLGRGFYLYASEDGASFEVVTPLPTTVNDLEDMFAFAEQMAIYLGAKEVSDESGVYPRAMLTALYPDVLKKNLELLKSYALSRPGFTVSGVRFPVQIPDITCGRIAALPPQHGEKFFSVCLDEKQRTSLGYLMPEFYRDAATGLGAGQYFIREGQSAIIPKSPFVPYGPAPFGEEPVAAWLAHLASGQLGTLGVLPYGVFLERLAAAEKRDFDARHYVLQTLNLRRLQEILDGN